MGVGGQQGRAPAQQAAQRLVVNLCQRPGRMHSLEEAQFAPIDVAQAGRCALVDERGADAGRAEARLAQAAQRLLDIEARIQQLRPEARELRMDGQRPAVEQLDRRRIEADTDSGRCLEHRDCPRRRPPPTLTRPVAMPRAVHPEVRVQRQAAREADQQVLAARDDVFDLLSHRALQRGTAGTPTRAAHPLPDQRRVQHLGNPGERVALRHAPLRS
jgi:hypothetical protein